MYSRKFFQKNNSKASLIYLSLLSLLLIFIDTKYYISEKTHNFAIELFDRQINSVSKITDFKETLFLSLSDKHELLHKSRRLEAENMMLELQLEIASNKLNEYKKLKSYNEYAEKNNFNYVIAKALHLQTTPFVNEIMINKGIQDGININDVVVNTEGVVGLVSEVFEKTSRVHLIVAKDFALPALEKSTNQRVIVNGIGSNSLLAMDIYSKDFTIADSTEVITSGLGNIFPFGLKIGKALEANYLPSKAITYVTLQPYVNFSNLDLVLVISNDK